MDHWTPVRLRPAQSPYGTALIVVRACLIVVLLALTALGWFSWLFSAGILLSFIGEQILGLRGGILLSPSGVIQVGLLRRTTPWALITGLATLGPPGRRRVTLHLAGGRNVLLPAPRDRGSADPGFDQAFHTVGSWWQEHHGLPLERVPSTRPTVGAALLAAGAVSVTLFLISTVTGFDVPVVTAQKRPAVWETSMPVELSVDGQAVLVDDVVVITGYRSVAALDRATGRLLWHADHALRVSPEAKAALVDRPGGTGMEVLDLRTGTTRFTLPDDVTFAAVRGDLAIHTQHGQGKVEQVVAIGLKDGARRWQVPLPGVDYAQVDDATTGGIARASTPVLVRAGESTYISLDPATGKELARLPRDAHLTSAFAGESVLLRWRTDDSDCTNPVSAVDLRTGRTLWSHPVGLWSPRARLWSSQRTCGESWRPRTDGVGLLTLIDQGRPAVLDLQSGRVRWTGERGWSPVALSGDVTVVRAEEGQGDLIGVDVAAGKQLWTAEPGLAYGEEMDDPVISARYLANSGLDDRFDPLVVVRDLRSGAVAWTAEAGGVLGMGDSWLLAKGDWSSAETVRMYALGG